MAIHLNNEVSTYFFKDICDTLGMTQRHDKKLLKECVDLHTQNTEFFPEIYRLLLLALEALWTYALDTPTTFDRTLAMIQPKIQSSATFHDLTAPQQHLLAAVLIKELIAFNELDTTCANVLMTNMIEPLTTGNQSLIQELAKLMVGGLLFSTLKSSVKNACQTQ